ncbi:MAG: TIGR02466 family protein [Acidiferrobacterales bacterium]|nr:TIGR02466 family protein [Acidiferrobacterales bacterium]
MSEAKILSWFATPIATVKIAGSESLNDALAALFLEREREGERYRHEVRIPTQVGAVFESRFDLFDWPDPPVQQLAQACHDALYDLVQTLNGYSEEEMDRFTFFYESWFHVTRKGGYQSVHYHPGASWSGIYAVRTGDRVEDRPESGQVKFYDPRGASFMHVDPGNRQMDPRYSTTPVYLDHEPGQLVLFPSWLMHEVLPYVGESGRMVVAFNASLSANSDSE